MCGSQRTETREYLRVITLYFYEIRAIRHNEFIKFVVLMNKFFSLYEIV